MEYSRMHARARHKAGHERVDAHSSDGALTYPFFQRMGTPIKDWVVLAALHLRGCCQRDVVDRGGSIMQVQDYHSLALA